MTKRILSAIVLVLIFVPLMLIGEVYFSVFMGILGILGLYELIHIRETKKEFPLITKLFAYIMFILLMYFSYGKFDYQFTLDFRYIAVMIFLFITPIVFINDSKKYNVNDALYLIGSLVFLGISFSLLALVRNYNLLFFIYLLLIQTVTDSFALFTGKYLGDHKFTSISPNKTIEGVIGGSVMGTFVAVAFYSTVINPGMNLFILILITLILSFVGQIGDLVFSSIKRYYEKKDFSDLIPGHGGILDRFDSILFITMAFILIIKYL